MYGALGLFGTWLLQEGYSVSNMVSAEKAAIISVLEPVVTVIPGVLFLNESLNWMQIVGVLIILVGTLASTLSVHPH